MCDDYWGIDDARVVFDNLAFLVLLLLYKGSSVQDGTGDIWLDNVAYTVNERSQ